MRPIDWSPLVVLGCAIAAAALASALPDSFFLKKETAAIIIWVPMVLVVLKAIRMIREQRNFPEKPQKFRNEEFEEENEDENIGV